VAVYATVRAAIRPSSASTIDKGVQPTRSECIKYLGPDASKEDVDDMLLHMTHI